MRPLTERRWTTRDAAAAAAIAKHDITVVQYNNTKIQYNNAVKNYY